MLVVGVDLSLTATGIARFDGTYVLLRPGTRRGPERLVWLRDAIIAFAVATPDTIVAVEGYSYGSHSSSYDLGELGGVVRTGLYEADIRYIDVPPATVKGYATGKGNANKNEVLVAAVKRLGYDGTSSDEADALWCRAAVLAVLGEPVVEMPQVNQKHLEKLALLLEERGLRRGVG
jgi:Holliday junction resolvasome RuvABC endonuclease subunit